MKEELQKLRCVHLADRNKNNLCKAIKRVEQLELEKQKLINALEINIKPIEKDDKYTGENVKIFLEGILKDLKGE